MTTLRIATRKSQLALWQTEHVATRLREAHPGLQVALVPLSTRGDEILDRSLAAIGGKGLFLKELELAMQRGEADCAVHSLKDVPMELEPGFALAAILARGDPADARPDLQLRDLRGNVNTRLAKLDAGEFDAIVLACAGLQRLGFGERIRARLDAPAWLPAPAQGAIAIECRSDDPQTQALCAALDDAETRSCVAAERAMNRALHGSCHVPVAALARREGSQLLLQGLVGAVADGRSVRAEAGGAAEAPDALGLRVAEALLAQGARVLIDGL